MIRSTTFLGAGETFSLDRCGSARRRGALLRRGRGAGSEGFPDLSREARSDITVGGEQDDDGVADAAHACASVVGPAGGEVPGCVVVDSAALGQLTTAVGSPAARCRSAQARATRASPPCSSRSGGSTTQADAAPWSQPSWSRRRPEPDLLAAGGYRRCRAARASSPQRASARHRRVRSRRVPGPGVRRQRRRRRARQQRRLPQVGARPSTVTRSVGAAWARPASGEGVGDVSWAGLPRAPPAPLRPAAQVWQVARDGARIPLGLPARSLAGGSSRSSSRWRSNDGLVVVSALVSADAGVARCARPAESAPVVAFGDRDDDTVPDADDCPTSRASPAAAGCPWCSGLWWRRTPSATSPARRVRSARTSPPMPSRARRWPSSPAPVAAGALQGTVGPTGYEVEVGRPAPVDADDARRRTSDEVAVCAAVQPAIR